MVLQNYFLNVTTATYVVNASNGDAIFTSKTGDKDGYDRSIREWVMKAKTADDTYYSTQLKKAAGGSATFSTRRRERKKQSNG